MSNVPHSGPISRLAIVWGLAAAAFTSSLAVAQTPKIELPKTEYSRHMQALSREFNAAAKDVPPIVIMDRDELELNLALRHVDVYDSKTPEQLVADVTEAQTGLKVDPARFSQVTQTMTLERGNTFSPGRGPSQNMAGGGFCMVFAEPPDQDGPTQLRDLMDLNGVFAALSGRTLLNPLPLSVINTFTDYHELGHCLYPYPSATEDMTREERFQRVQKAEMFGDVLATLLLTRDGVTDFGARYARVHLSHLALTGMGDNYTYATWDGLEAAQREVDALGTRGLKKMSLRQIRDIAERITAENTVTWPVAALMMSFEARNFEEAVLTEAVARDPGAAKAAAYVLKLKTRMNDALSQTVDLPQDVPGLAAGFTPVELAHFYLKHPPPDPPETAEAVSDKDFTAGLQQKLIAEAGGPRATAVKLENALDRQKDALRRDLVSTDEATRKNAMRSLPLMARAFSQALDQAAPPVVAAGKTAPKI